MNDTTRVSIGARYCGPPRSGNGGFVAGTVAERLPAGAHQVSLRLPPPLDTALELRCDDEGSALWDGDALVAEGRAVPGLAPAPGAVVLDEAEEAATRFPGLVSHPFPTCFACGTETAGGLRIFPGPTAADASLFASPWDVGADAGGELAVPVAWAALDCVGGWAGDLTDRVLVLGRMSGHVHRLPEPGERLVAVGRERAREGRRTMTASALYDGDGDLVAQAEHVWVEVDPARFLSAR